MNELTILRNYLFPKTWGKLTVQARREKLTRLHALMLESTHKEVTIEPVHTICNGIYARTIHIPEGTLLVGDIHKTAQINIVSKGCIQVVTEEGSSILHAGDQFVSPAGTKRAGVAITDVTWTVLHATDLTDVEEIRKVFIVDSYEQLEQETTNVMDRNSISSVHGSDNVRGRPKPSSSETGAAGRGNRTKAE